MIDQDTPTELKQFATPTGLRVRQDLYDEEYSDSDYETMLSLYEGTMASILCILLRTLIEVPAATVKRVR